MTKKVKKCDCRICKRSKRFTKFLKDNKFNKKDRDFIENIFSELYNAEEDSDYLRCIMEGHWPTSVKILTKALERAKEVEAKEEAEKTKSHLNGR